MKLVNSKQIAHFQKTVEQSLICMMDPTPTDRAKAIVSIHDHVNRDERKHLMLMLGLIDAPKPQPVVKPAPESTELSWCKIHDTPRIHQKKPNGQWHGWYCKECRNDKNRSLKTNA